MIAYDNRLTTCPGCGRALIPDPYENPRTVNVLEEVILPPEPPQQVLELPVQGTQEQEPLAQAQENQARPAPARRQTE